MTMSDVGKKWREGHFGGAVKWLIDDEPREMRAKKVRLVRF
jgi:hypothetical protein